MNTNVARSSSTEVEFVVLGRRIAAKRWGTVGGAPTLALHGWLDNANSFDVLAPMLQKLDLVALDFAGHGHSDHRPPGINYFGLLDVQDVMAVANQLGWERFNIIGHSMGAEVGGNLLGLFPERVPRLACIDGFPEGCSEARVLDAYRNSIQLNLTKASHPGKVFTTRAAMAERVAEATGQSLHSAALLVARGTREVVDGFMWQSDPRVRWGDTLRVADEQLDGILARYEGRILIVAAQEGAKWYRESVTPRCARFANMTMVEVPGNHHLHMDDTAVRVAELINGFLAE